jgi:hypothetical protein
MMNRWRPLALAAALNVALCVGVADAQTVIVRNAPAGSTIELGLNAATIGSAVADASGTATLAVPGNVSKTETDAYVYVDVCDKMRRVLLLERGQPAPPAGACDRSQIVGLFLVRRVSTLVVDVGGPNPTVLLRQGPVDLRSPDRAAFAAPTGLVLFGGGGFGKFGNARAIACGNVGTCAGDESGLMYTAGAAYWLTNILAAEVSYLRPAEVTVDGSGDNFQFNSSLDAHVVTIAGKIGAPVGRVRFYGQAGMNYHRATFSTTQTIDDATVTIDEVTETIEGGTQSFELKTAGWGWQFGGGVEIWVAPFVAIYGEGGRAVIKGDARDGGEGSLDDHLTYALGGVRIRIGG